MISERLPLSALLQKNILCLASLFLSDAKPIGHDAISQFMFHRSSELSAAESKVELLTFIGHLIPKGESPRLLLDR